MKKIILEIMLALTLQAAALHTFFNNIFGAEKNTNKEISFTITRDTNYNQKVYDMATASVRVVIFKVSNHKQTILWSKVYGNMLLKNFPVNGQGMGETVTIRNISDRKEKLFVTYMVTYNNKGSVMELQNGTTVSKGVTQNKVEINI